MGFYRFQNEDYFKKKCNVDTVVVVSNVTCTGPSVPTSWSYDFYDQALSTE